MRALALILLALPPAALAQEPLPGLRDLPLARSSRAVLFSSRDPTGGNDDHGHYMAEGDGGRKVLAACRGPGRITRLWSANPTGTVRIELDGQTAWEGPFATLLSGTAPGFRPPLAGRGMGGGFLSLVPMPFKASCVVSAVPDDPDALYYQVGVELRPESATYDPARPSLFERDIAALLDPGFPIEAALRARREAVRVDGEPVVVFTAPDRPVEVVALRVTPHGHAFAERNARRVWLEVSLPGEDRPSLAAPLGDILGVAFDQAGIDTLPVHAVGRARVLRFPMPLRPGAVVRLAPAAPDGDPLTFDVDVAYRGIDDERLPLRATFRRTPSNAPTVPFELLTLSEEGAPGHYVGAFLALAGASGQGVTFLEGDEAIAVDGEDPPAIQGTGTEDDLNGAWYFRGGTFRAPWHALATLDERRGRVAVARFRGPDPVPFHRSITVRLEHGGRNDAPGSDYAATTFWYGGPPPDVVPATTRRAWAEPQGAPAPVTVAVGDGGTLTLDPRRREEALLLDRDVLVDAPGHAPIVSRIGARGLALDAAPGTRVRVAPWLPSIRAFRVAGPFRPSAPRHGVDDVFGPERDPAPDATYDDVAGDGPRGWRVLEGPGTWTGYVDLNPLFSPNDEVVAYAACVVVSPRDQDATLVLGSDDAVVVFLDGREIHRNVLLRGAGRDQDRVPVHLHQGEQTLLIKVEDYFGGFGLFARFEGADALEVRAR